MRVEGLDFRVWGLGSRVWGLGFVVWGLGSRVQGLGFGVRSEGGATHPSQPSKRTPYVWLTSQKLPTTPVYVLAGPSPCLPRRARILDSDIDQK